MRLSADVLIRAPRKTVWEVIADIPNAPATIRGIQKVEVLARPAQHGLVGLKWRETRTLFGKEANAVMWITDEAEGARYATRSEEQGAVFTKSLALADVADGTKLTVEFRSAPQTFAAKVGDVLFRPLMMSAGRKAIAQDLEDIKRAAEGRAAAPKG